MRFHSLSALQRRLPEGRAADVLEGALFPVGEFDDDLLRGGIGFIRTVNDRMRFRLASEFGWLPRLKRFAVLFGIVEVLVGLHEIEDREIV